MCACVRAQRASISIAVCPFCDNFSRWLQNHTTHPLYTQRRCRPPVSQPTAQNQHVTTQRRHHATTSAAALPPFCAAPTGAHRMCFLFNNVGATSNTTLSMSAHITQTPSSASSVAMATTTLSVACVNYHISTQIGTPHTPPSNAVVAAAAAAVSASSAVAISAGKLSRRRRDDDASSKDARIQYA